MIFNKLKIGFSLNSSNSGPSNFLKNLKSSFKKSKLVKTTLFLDPLSNINIYSNKVRNPWNKSYIFRVDGVGFDLSKSKNELEITNFYLKKGIKNSLGVVYQSQFSKNLSENILKLEPINSTIILNGTDLTKFNKNGGNLRLKLGIPKDALVFISSAIWRPRKRLKDMIDIFIKFKKYYEKETFFIVIGKENYKDEKNNIIYIPLISNNELPDYLRTADIYFFLGWLDPCPNSVVEAIACGLPVVCSNSGGTPELVKSTNAGIIVEEDYQYSFDTVDLQRPPSIDHNNVLNSIKSLVKNLNSYKKGINIHKVDINFVAEKYLEFIKKINHN